MTRGWIPSLAVAGLLLVGCSPDSTIAPTDGSADATIQERGGHGHGHHGHHRRGHAVIANRGSGSISIVDARDATVAETIALPRIEGDAMPEPMYVVYTPSRRRVLVGDRANDRVVAFDSRTYEVEGMADAGDGVFHMWADPQGRRLWVNNDVDNTTSVIDTRHLTTVATVPTPADLVAMGGKPHDVIVGPRGHYAYVSLVGLGGENDYVVQFDARTFNEVGRVAVGKDPHLSLARQHNRLYVPCQGSDVVLVFDRRTLEPITSIDVPGAHGAGMSRNGKTFYTANLPGGGDDALFTIDTRRNEVIGSPTDSPYPVPHNIAVDRPGCVLVLTHSGGTADKVTLYRTSRWQRTPTLVGEVTVGLNPFGLAYVD